MDGSSRAAWWLRQDVPTYASCIEQPGMKLFVLAAHEGTSVSFADTTNAFQQLPPPLKNCYVAVDEAYRDWYKAQYGVTLDINSHVLPLKKALQGHPEAGASFERLINSGNDTPSSIKRNPPCTNLHICQWTLRGWSQPLLLPPHT